MHSHAKRLEFDFIIRKLRGDLHVQKTTLKCQGAHIKAKSISRYIPKI